WPARSVRWANCHRSELPFVAPHERSDMRDFPGYRFAHPGYEAHVLAHRHADAAADAVRARQARVGSDDIGDAGADVGREGGDLAHAHVDMDGHVLRGGREPAFARMAQLLEGVQALFVGP